MYNARKTATKGGNEAAVLIVSAIIAKIIIPQVQEYGIDIDPVVLSGAIITAVGTLSRIIGNYWKHR